MQYQSSIRPSVRLAVVLFCTLIVPGVLGHQERPEVQPGRVITGRVVDPHQLRPEDAVLMLGQEVDGAFSSVPISLESDGSFVTPRLSPGTYVLKIVCCYVRGFRTTRQNKRDRRWETGGRGDRCARGALTREEGARRS
jgi:hypothetical protein